MVEQLSELEQYKKKLKEFLEKQLEIWKSVYEMAGPTTKSFYAGRVTEIEQLLKTGIDTFKSL
ncbi:hypothetical protein M0R19_04990 [Candidatus Pacearchaeota archaeon]|jgi:hypothetical protein|nr:hypothetical protein [Candidatus Pacearchaeota archaeon]